MSFFVTRQLASIAWHRFRKLQANYLGMFFRTGVVFCLVLASLRAAAINAVVSNTVFYLPDSVQSGKLLPYVETSWDIIPHTLHFRTTTDKKIVARVKTDILYTIGDSLIQQDHFTYTSPARTSVDEISSNKIIYLRRYFLPPGKIKMWLTFTDEFDSTNTYFATDSFVIAKPDDKPFFSKLQILDTFFESSDQNAFSKNDMEQIPLNGCFLDEGKKILHYYAELYHGKSLPADAALTQKVFLSKKEGESPFQFFEHTDSFVGQDVGVVMGSFDITSLGSGNYYLNALVENKYHQPLVTASLFFQRVNKHPSKEDTLRRVASDTSLEKINVLDMQKTFMAKFTTDQLRSMLRMMLPISDAIQTQAIQGFLDKPDELYSRYFIYNFFAALNAKEPAKAWRDYSEKVIKVNKSFRSPGKPGYLTDRGFYYLRYGAPTEIIPAENEPGALPYEIWRYNQITQTNGKIATNCVFLFYKQNPSVEDFRLLHSTVGGEPQNNNWRANLILNGDKSSTSNHRADEYLSTGR